MSLDWMRENPHSVIVRRAEVYQNSWGGQTRALSDHRGWFMDLGSPLLDDSVVEIKRSFSQINVARGMHQQPGKPQIKELTVLDGFIYDLAYDPYHELFYVIKLDVGDRILLGEKLYHGFVTTAQKADVLYNIHLNGWDSSYENSLPIPIQQINITNLAKKRVIQPVNGKCSYYSRLDLKISEKDSIGTLDIRQIVAPKL